MNVKERQARERSTAIERIQRQRFWIQREHFRAADIAQCLNTNVSYCRDLLKTMVENRECSVEESKSGILYRRCNLPPLNRMSWADVAKFYEEQDCGN